MAVDYTINVTTIYPNGTEIFVYFRSDIPIGHLGAPVGTAVTSAVMTNGSATFEDLEVNTYVAAGLVNGSWRYVGFSVDQPPHLALFTDSERPDAEITGQWRFTEQTQVGYNPSVDLEPTNPRTWNAIDFVVVTDLGTGNRFHARSGNLTNIGDPPELVFRRSGPKGSAPWGPSGLGPLGQGDGTEAEGLVASSTIGFIGWQGFVPGTSNTDGSFQAFGAVEAAHMTEDARQDTLSVNLAGDTSTSAETITITGNMDSVAAPVDGRVTKFYDTGTVGCTGRTIRYASRSATKLFGCELVSGTPGTLLAGASVNQQRLQAGATWTILTAVRTTGERHPRIQAGDDGELGIGHAAISAGLSKFFTVAGGASHFKQIRKISNLTASVVGTPGTATITYQVIARSPDGSAVDPVSVQITNAPNTLNETNYVKLDWQGGLGTSRYDIVRSATDGSPATTGPIIRNQPWIRGPGAADTGLAPIGINEVQQIGFTRADGGTFRLEYNGEFTGDLAYPPTAGTIETALEGLSGIGAGNVNVTGGGSSQTYEIEFIGALAATNVVLIGGDPTNLTNADDLPHTPQISPRTLTSGLATPYTTPTRNETGDVAIDGEATVNQAVVLKEQASDPPAPGGTQGKVYTKASGSRTSLHLQDSTGVKDILDSVSGPAAFNLSGTHAARPAAGTAGRTYFETNTNVLYRDTGSVWQAVSSGFVRKAANETINNSDVLQNDDHLSFPIEVNEEWFVEAHLRLVSTTATPGDFKFTWTGPAGASALWGVFGSSAITAGNWNAVDTATAPGGARGLTETVAIGSVNGVHLAKLAGRFVAAATAGTIQLQWAQNTAAVADATVATGSLLRLTRVL